MITSLETKVVGKTSDEPQMGRRIAIADVHGCCRTFQRMVQDTLHLGEKDSLYVLGDHIDRGPCSRDVLEYLMHLLAEGYDVHPLRGNHEQLLLDAVHSDDAFEIWKGNGGLQTLQQFDVNHPRDLPAQFLEFIAAMPLMVLFDDYVLIHGGLNFRKENPLYETSDDDLLWARDYRVIPSKLAGRTLISGHTVTPLFEIRDSIGTRHIRLDNGCYDRDHIGYGALVAIDLDSTELFVVPNCE